MRVYPILLSIVFCSLSFSSYSQTAAQQADANGLAREHNVNFTNLKLEVSFEPTKKMVKGKVTHTFIPIRTKVDSIWFDGIDITIHKATLDGKELKYRNTESGIWVYPKPSLTWGETHNIVFDYTANPKRGIYFVGWDDPKNISRKQIWTQGQGIDNRHWIPMYDERNDKVVTEMIVTMDKNYKVLSNGLVQSMKMEGENRIWHYKISHPHATYLIMLGIGVYDIDAFTAGNDIPVNHYYYPDEKHKVGPTYHHTKEMFPFMAEETGIPYPWETYSQIPVQDFMYGAMENTTATLFGDYLFTDDRQALDREYLGVNIHEFVHQWFGDYITAYDPNGAWLQEGFATYYSKLYRKQILGEDEYQWIQWNEAKGAFGASENNNYPIGDYRAGRRIYPKGSFVIEMLRDEVGDEEFKAAIYHYLKRHAYNNVTSEDLLQAFRDTTGRTLNWFFDQWVYGGGEPEFEISYDRTDELKVTVKQIHNINDSIGLFNVPVVLQANFIGGTQTSKKVWINKKEQTFVLDAPADKKLTYLVFDPGNRILKKEKFNRSPQELGAQLLNAANMIDRYRAAKALRKVELKDKLDYLAQAWKKETFYAVRAEIVRQLVNEDDAMAAKIITQAIASPMAEVRKATVQHVEKINPAMISEYKKLLKDKQYQTIELALQKLSEANPDDVAKYVEMTKDEKGFAMLVPIKRYELMVEHSVNRAEGLENLKKLSSNSYEFRTRVKAIEALQELNYLDEEQLTNLFQAGTHFNNRLRDPALEALKHYHNSEKAGYKKMITAKYQANPNWTTQEIKWLETIISFE